MRDVDISPDGKYFVVVTTGAYNRRSSATPPPGGTSSRTGSNLLPEWTNYTRWRHVDRGRRHRERRLRRWPPELPEQPVHRGCGRRRGGSARRSGRPRSPAAAPLLNWDPSRERGYGVYGFEITSTGLWIGSDTVHLGRTSRTTQRLAFMPLRRGLTCPPTRRASCRPGRVPRAEQGGTGTSLDRGGSRTFRHRHLTSPEATTRRHVAVAEPAGRVHGRRQAVHRLVRHDVQGPGPSTAPPSGPRPPSRWQLATTEDTGDQPNS